MALFGRKDKLDDDLYAAIGNLSDTTPEKKGLFGRKSKGTDDGPKVKAMKYKLPRINMLPESLVLANKRRQQRRMFLIIGMGMMAAVGLVWFGQAPAIQFASERVATANQQMQETMQSVNRLRVVGEYYDGLEARANVAVDAASKQVNYSEISKGIFGAAPPGVTLSQLTISYTGAPDAAAAGGAPAAGAAAGSCGTQNDPFAAPTAVTTLGCITFTGSAPNTTSLSQFIRSLESVTTIQYVFVAPGGAAGENGTIAFTGTAAIADTANVNDAAKSVVNVDGLPGIRPPGSQAERPAAGQPVTQPAAGSGQ